MQFYFLAWLLISDVWLINLACIYEGGITVYGHFSAVTFFSRLGDLSQIADWYFRGRRAQTTRKFLFCYITSITCSKSRSWYFRGLDANRENRENMVTAEKWRFTVCIVLFSISCIILLIWPYFCGHLIFAVFVVGIQFAKISRPRFRASYRSYRAK